MCMAPNGCPCSSIAVVQTRAIAILMKEKPQITESHVKSGIRKL